MSLEQGQSASTASGPAFPTGNNHEQTSMPPHIVHRANRRHSRRYQGQSGRALAFQISAAIPRLSRRANGRAIPVNDLETRPATKPVEGLPTEIEPMREVQ